MRRLIFCILTGVVALGLTLQKGYTQGGGPPGEYAYVSAIAIDPSNPAVVYAGTARGWVFKSSNGGSSWSAVNSGSRPIDVYSLAIDPVTPVTLYAGTGGLGVYKSANGGTSWSAVNAGLTDTFVIALAIDPSNPAILYAGTHGGIFKSTNRGASWSAANVGITNTRDRVYELVIDPSNPTTLYAGTEGGGVFKSANGAASWTTVNSGLTDTYDNDRYVYALAIDPVSPATLYAGTGNGHVFKSTNAGASWIAVNSSSGVHALAIDPSNPATLYAGTGNGVFKSADRGDTWSLVSSISMDVYSLAIDRSTPATLYAGTDGAGVFKTTDAGATWQPTGAALEDGEPPTGNPAVSEGGVVNIASLGSVSPGSIAAVLGINLNDGSTALSSGFGSDGRLATSLGGSRVTVNSIPAPLFYSLPTQLGIQIPFELAGQTSATIQVQVGQRTSAPRAVSLQDFAPGIFTFSQTGQGAAAVLHQADFTLVTASSPARRGEIVVLYATGLGSVTPPLATGQPATENQTVTPALVTIDGLPAEVLSSGAAPGFVGLYRITGRIPANTNPGTDIPLVLSIGGKQSNPVTIPVAE